MFAWLFGKKKHDGAIAPADAFADKARPKSLSRMAAPSSRPFPHFRATAGDHLGPQAESAFARTRMKLHESFTPSQPVSDLQAFRGAPGCSDIA